MHKPRPVYLDLTGIRQPLSAVVSFLHRISGALLFVLLPCVLYVFELSLADEASFARMAQQPLLRFALGGVALFYGYHLLAGVRFLIFDLHRPGLYRYAQVSARLVLLGAVLVGMAVVSALW
ncbi:succinate dehydrogenase, cytochrome b556 subunit [Thiobacter aerophilum]|uniref:Succinate dehydrogenase cytochrome b556 subunit n=1 Tax=Thiobacter aerophilum TaxID=3121275 RepID=A0ABV0EAW3_9BURK